MNEVDALSIGQAAVWTVILASLPSVVTAMVIGTSIALLQALTQVQEVTLTFIPKIVAVAVALIIFMPWILSRMTSFSTFAFEKIATIGH